MACYSRFAFVRAGIGISGVLCAEYGKFDRTHVVMIGGLACMTKSGSGLMCCDVGPFIVRLCSTFAARKTVGVGSFLVA